MSISTKMTVHEISDDKARVSISVGDGPIEATTDSPCEAIEVSVVIPRISGLSHEALRYHALLRAGEIIKEARDQAHDRARDRLR